VGGGDKKKNCLPGRGEKDNISTVTAPNKSREKSGHGSRERRRYLGAKKGEGAYLAADRGTRIGVRTPKKARAEKKEANHQTLKKETPSHKKRETQQQTEED